MPYPTGNIHPRFWGWVMGTGTADGLLADLIASTMNAQVAGFDDSPSAIERQVIGWMCELFAYPTTATGILVSGGTVANLSGLLVARRAKAGFDVRAAGLAGHPQLTVYGSTETHSWARDACDTLGLGAAAFRKVPVDEQYRIRLDALAEAIAEDRAAGHRPICVVGNAGTVNTGALDNLNALADLCKREELWFHVDGALGGLAVMSDALAPLVEGIGRADSIAFDLHKWGYLQYETGCLLVREANDQVATFRAQADYLDPPGRGIQPQSLGFAERGLQLSRGFRGLRVWMAFRTHGVSGIARIIEQNVAQVRHLSELIKADDRLELMAPAPLNVACFRYHRPGLTPEALDALNREVLIRIQEEGVAVPSSTIINGRFAIRIAHANHRTISADFDTLVDAVVRLGDELSRPREPAM
jgi:glutamate/tyrosine decarboxylase-like PLP-dependent enzyme